MSNQHSTLTGLFSDIADAIREKRGSSASIVADAFPTAIRAIPSGGGGDDIAISILDGTISEYTNSNITQLRAYAFYRCTNLKSANFPLITTVNAGAFGECTSLSEISMPAVATVGSSAFTGCALTDVYLPNCDMIGASAFYNCKHLTSISLPNCD